MRRLTLGVLMLAAVAVAACEDDNGPEAETYRATLTGAAERPNPNNSTATGTVTWTVTPTGLDYTITTSGLTPTPSAGHIHGPAGVDGFAGVIVPFFSAATSTGTINGSGTVPNSSFSIPRDSVLKLLRAGQTYTNVHTVPNFGGGEIRGQNLCNTGC